MRAPPHPPKRKRVATRRVTDGEEGGRERRHTGEEGGTAAPRPHTHCRRAWPAPSALALLLKFQLCTQPSWLAASHVPAPGWAAGSGARGGHMDEKPGSAEPRAGRPLGPETQSLAGAASPALSAAQSSKTPAFVNTQEVPEGETGGWAPRGPGKS